ncbi:hypothetical protein AWJ20_1039 [Sugiyamaella lignohabitans]|uniref:Uncharacterized protein n=1 Tax=Sugiyamaella lignohabitans TaxID=796027 RepID=A0A167DCR1_9ASCO|nr:uncharacterized protein AWJ20_1039 [Sugiyamaella lignohabitans]ANB12769.1 hypothetical protein AWJ20_1039 [Sugiyamaella lignohabitans]
MTKSILSIVWIAGPISGLVMQPVIGVLSDNCTSQYGRRRPYMVVGSLMVSFGLVIMAWAKDIADLVFTGHAAKMVALVIATFAIFLTDFSINAVQACCRAIIVDTLPPESQELGNGWAGRMIAIGHLIGYFCGAIDLVSVTGGWLGDTQLKELVIISALALLITVSITSFAVTERVLLASNEGGDQSEDGQEDNGAFKSGSGASIKARLLVKSVLDVFITLRETIWKLPPTIALIFKVQLCAWYGWFGFLFYSSTWVGEVYFGHVGHDDLDTTDPVGDMARQGATALVVFSFVSLASSLIFPELIGKSSSVVPMIRRHSSPSLNTSTSRIVVLFYSLLSLLLVPVKLVLESGQKVFETFNIELPDLWFAAHIVYAIATFSSAFVVNVKQATCVVALCGFSWAITTWAPFALLGEEILQFDGSKSVLPVSEDSDTEPLPEDNLIGGESSTNPAFPKGSKDSDSAQAGVYLGIHNVAITVPQLVATFVSFLIFSFAQTTATETSLKTRSGATVEDGPGDGGLAIARTLQVGSLTALLAAYYTRRYKKARAASRDI